MKLSACMIVQDEEECLARALDSIEPYVDEIIIVDGGSIDKTKEIAISYAKVKIFDIPFPDNFAVQKNNAIERASGDWILFMDADEYYDDYTVANLARLMDNGKYDAYAFSRKTFIDGYLINIFNHDFQVRLFGNHCKYEAGELGFSEQVVGYNNLQLCNLVIKHYKKADWQHKDNVKYWNMGLTPPPGWLKVDGKWTWMGMEDSWDVQDKPEVDNI